MDHSFTGESKRIIKDIDYRPQLIQVIVIELSCKCDMEFLLASLFIYIQTIITANENNKFVIYIITGNKR
jgi:hypothetical protein